MLRTYKRQQAAGMLFLCLLTAWTVFALTRESVSDVWLFAITVHLLTFVIVFFLPIERIFVHAFSAFFFAVESVIFIIIGLHKSDALAYTEAWVLFVSLMYLGFGNMLFGLKYDDNLLRP